MPETLPLSSSASKNLFSRDVFKILTGTTIGQILNALATPVLARIYTPEDIGTYGVFLAIVAIFLVIITLRYEVAIILPEKEEDGASLLVSSLIISILVSGTIALLIPYTGNAVLELFRSPELLPYLWMVPVTLVLMGFYQSFNYWNTRTKSFGRLSVSRIILTVVTLIIQIGVGVWLGSNPAILNAGFAAGFVAASSALLFLIWRDDHRLLKPAIQWSRLVSNLKRYKKFPLVDSWANLLYAISWQVPPLLIAIYFTKAQVGYYSLAYRLIQMPVALIGAAVSQVLSQRASELRNDKEKLVELTGSVYRRLLILGLFPSLLLAVLGKPLFIFLFGAGWAEAGVYVQILAIWMFFWFTSYPLVMIASVLEHQEVSLILHVVNLATRLLALYIGSLNNDIFLGLWLFSLSGIVIYLATIFINLRLAHYSLKTASLEMVKLAGGNILLISPLIVLAVLQVTPWVLFAVAAGLSLVYARLYLRKGILSF